MEASGTEQADVVATLQQKLPAALGTAAMPGTEGWTLEVVRSERFFGHPVTSLGFAHGDRSLDCLLFPSGAAEAPFHRGARFDVVYTEDPQGSRLGRDRAVLDQLVRWLGATFPAPAPGLAPTAREAAEPPRIEPEDVVATLEQKLPAALGTAAMPGTEGWAIKSVRTDRFFGHPVISLALSHGDRAIDCQLFPANALESPYYRDDRFDFVYIDDDKESRVRKDREVIDQFVRWLGATFKPRARRLAAIPPAASLPTTAAPAAPDPSARDLVAALEAALSLVLREGALPGLAGWSLAGVTLESFRGHETPTLKLAHGRRTPRLHLLPSGSDKGALHRTKRFDILYDDAWDMGSPGDPAAIEELAAWLDRTFPAGDRRKARPLPQPSDPSFEAEALSRSVDEALSQAMRDKALPELAGWSLEEVGVEAFRGKEAPVVKLSHGGRALSVHLLPAGTDAKAFFRTGRFDVLYDDDEQATKFALDHGVIERLTTWLNEAFPAGEEARQKEIARRRAALDQKARLDPALAALAEEVERKLRAAQGSGEFTLPEGWVFEGASVEWQQGAAAPAVRFVHGAKPFTFRLLPTDPRREAYLRTSRFDVLYDSEQGDWQLQDEPLSRRFVMWLAAALPAQAPEQRPASAGDAPRPQHKPTNAIDPAMAALALELDQALSTALGTSALPNAEGWALKHVAVQEFQGATAVEVVLLLRDRSLIFYVMPTNSENRAYRRTTRLDLLYEDDAQGAHFTRDKAMIDEFTSWLSTWDAPPPGPSAEPAPDTTPKP